MIPGGLQNMVDIDQIVAAIRRKRTIVTDRRSVLIGISGIDGSGKGYVTQQIQARLAQHSLAAAAINVDGWLNPPDRRFSAGEPGNHFYENAIRFDDLFRQLVLPLRNQKSLTLEADIVDETAQSYRKYTYRFMNVDVVLLEGILIFKREHRGLFDLAIWVDCSFSTALARALARRQEGLGAAATIRAYETIYFPAQRIHFDCDEPRDKADLIVNNDTVLDTCGSHTFVALQA